MITAPIQNIQKFSSCMRMRLARRGRVHKVRVECKSKANQIIEKGKIARAQISADWRWARVWVERRRAALRAAERAATRPPVEGAASQHSSPARLGLLLGSRGSALLPSAIQTVRVHKLNICCSNLLLIILVASEPLTFNWIMNILHWNFRPGLIAEYINLYILVECNLIDCVHLNLKSETRIIASLNFTLERNKSDVVLWIKYSEFNDYDKT